MAELHLSTAAGRDSESEDATSRSDSRSSETDETSSSAFESYIRGVVGSVEPLRLRSGSLRSDVTKKKITLPLFHFAQTQAQSDTDLRPKTKSCKQPSHTFVFTTPKRFIICFLKK